MRNRPSRLVIAGILLPAILSFAARAQDTAIEADSLALTSNVAIAPGFDMRLLLQAGTGAGQETRFALRGVYTTGPSDVAGLIGDGTGAGISITHFPASRGPGGDIGMHVTIEESQHRDSASREGTYHRAFAGFRWNDPRDGILETYLTAGAAYHKIEVSDGDSVAGTGAFVGVGAELELATAFTIGADANLHMFWSDTSDATPNAFTFGVSMSLRF